MTCPAAGELFSLKESAADDPPAAEVAGSSTENELPIAASAVATDDAETEEDVLSMMLA